MEHVSQCFQFGAQCQIIVDFAVEDDAVVSVRAKEWLITRMQIENLQACCAEGEMSRSIDALLIRTTMYERGRSGAYALRRWQPICMGKSDDSAQVVNSPAWEKGPFGFRCEGNVFRGCAQRVISSNAAAYLKADIEIELSVSDTAFGARLLCPAAKLGAKEPRRGYC